MKRRSNGWNRRNAPKKAVAASNHNTTGDCMATPRIMKNVQRTGDHLNHGPTSAKVASSRPQNPCSSRRCRIIGFMDMAPSLFHTPNVRVHRSAACGASGATRGWATFYSFLELRPATCRVLGLPLLAIELGDHQFLNGPSVKAPSVDTEAVRV